MSTVQREDCATVAPAAIPAHPSIAPPRPAPAPSGAALEVGALAVLASVVPWQTTADYWTAERAELHRRVLIEPGGAIDPAVLRRAREEAEGDE